MRTWRHNTMRRQTFQVLPITQVRQVQPLHVQTAGLQTLPQRQSGDAALITSASCLMHAIAVLEGQGVQNVLGRLIVPLKQCQLSTISPKQLLSATHPQVDTGDAQIESDASVSGRVGKEDNRTYLARMYAGFNSNAR